MDFFLDPLCRVISDLSFAFFLPPFLLLPLNLPPDTPIDPPLKNRHACMRTHARGSTHERAHSFLNICGPRPSHPPSLLCT